MANRVTNGDFAGNLSGWAASGNAAYVAGEGYNELGAASLPAAGARIEQGIVVSSARRYMLDVWAKTAAGPGNLAVTLTDGDGNEVYSKQAAADSAAWANVLGERIGLPPGSYTLSLAYSDVAITVDDVSLAWVLKTRAELAAEVAELLGDLATSDAGYTTVADGANGEGDYTTAVEVGLRAIGAVDDRGDPDVRCLDEQSVDGCIDEIQRFMLNKLHRYYARHATDFSLEGRSESYHQRVSAIENLLGIAVGGRPGAASRGVQVRGLHHRSGL